MKYVQPITIHHSLPASWGGNLQPQNAIKLKENVHRAVHTLFGDDTPIQRLRRTLEVDKSTMHPDVYTQISNTLARFEGEMEMRVYDPRIFNSDTFLKRQKKNA